MAARFRSSVTLGVREEQDRFGQRFRIGLLGVGQTGRVMQRVPAAELIPAATGYTVELTRSMIDGVCADRHRPAVGQRTRRTAQNRSDRRTAGKPWRI